MRLGWGRDDGPFFFSCPGRKPHERCEPGPILLCMGLFSRFCIWAPRCTAEEALRCGKVGTGFPSRQTRNAFARRSCSNKKLERDDDSKKSHPAPSQAAKSHFGFVAPVAALALMRIWPPSIFSTSKAPVLRTRSLSLLWP